LSKVTPINAAISVCPRYHLQSFQFATPSALTPKSPSTPAKAFTEWAKIVAA
jgi:hypothetical protein